MRCSALLISAGGALLATAYGVTLPGKFPAFPVAPHSLAGFIRNKSGKRNLIFKARSLLALAVGLSSSEAAFRLERPRTLT
jgi:hypothetical protein